MADDMLTGGTGEDVDAFDRQLMLQLREAIQARGLRRSRARRAAAGVIAAVVAGATAAVASLTLSTPAFALETDTDGDVTLTINRLEEADRLTRSLAAQGIRARIRYGADEAGTTCAGPRYAPVFTSRMVDEGLVVEIPHDSLLTRSDAVLHIEAAGDDPSAARLSYVVAGVPCADVGPATPGPDTAPTPVPSVPSRGPSAAPPSARPSPSAPARSEPSTVHLAPLTLQSGSVTTTTIQLTWHAPAETQGLTGYELYLDGALARTVSAGTLAATLSGLRPDTTYQLVAHSRYADGRRSAPSNLVQVRTHAEPPPPAGGSGLEVSFTTTSSWDSGYVGQYTLRNPTDQPISGWRLEFDLPTSVAIVQHWNADFVRSGSHVVADPVSWTESIPAGSFVTVGFETSGTTRPTGCRINGAPC